MQIALTYDLRDDYRKLGYSEEATAEFDSEETIAAIEAALIRMGHYTERVGNVWRLTEALASGRRWDLVFNICEGLHGMAREAQVPALLEAYAIPYTFSPPEVLMVAHDKSLAKLRLAQAGLPTARWYVITEESDLVGLDLPFPLFAKPVAEGTGKGISGRSLIDRPEDVRSVVCDLLERFSQPVLLETYLPGREFTVGIVGSGSEARLVGVMEIISGPEAEKGGHTYHNKEHCEALMEYRLAQDHVGKLAGELALAAWRLLEGRDAGRVDIRCDAHGNPNFLEVNPLAGLHPTHSDLPILAAMAGIPFQSLMEGIMDAVITRIQPKQHQLCYPCAC